ncbi:hypothetical protein QLQ12_18950 [Actinoplanes sp. NEAU-A12]|uniref:Streptomyces killer toxin-like beta/gamma crystallin domain-containing protein n=1 Tax=Actinoplanes sandaracinus TaxID=3045177 RepID=A0ABT6WLS2_9ACTN|nr:hypothetical protein [Actinoplanes sandaracinus]MDI6100691.1 hypothetical protein [Actinoplanes sandaracinus]
MRKTAIGVGLAAVAVAAGMSVPAAAFAAQIPCGNPTDVKVYLQSGTKICFAGVGQNSFNKVGVVKVEAGAYIGSVTVGTVRRSFQPGDTLRFQPPVDPHYITLKALTRP